MQHLKQLMSLCVFVIVIIACGSNQQSGSIQNSDTSGSIPGSAEERNNRDSINIQAATQAGGGTSNPAAAETGERSSGGTAADTARR